MNEKPKIRKMTLPCGATLEVQHAEEDWIVPLFARLSGAVVVGKREGEEARTPQQDWYRGTVVSPDSVVVGIGGGTKQLRRVAKWLERVADGMEREGNRKRGKG